MDSNPYPAGGSFSPGAKPAGAGPRPVSRLPMLIGVLIAVAVLLFLPNYLAEIEYKRMAAQVEAINQVLPQVGTKLEALSKAFGIIAAKVGPSVVFIRTNQVRSGNGFGGMYRVEGEASGVVIDPDGYIVTNNHVVENAQRIEVTLANNQQYTAEVVGTDPGSDLALIKIPATQLIAATWGDSDALQVGEWVLAVGNPYGLDRTVTFGIISAKNRHGESPTQDFLQTDAAVNPGNSGGPLVDMAGQVIGINTAIYGTTYQGISFALPSNMAKDVYERLKKGEKIGQSYGYLGVQLAQMTPDIAQRLGMQYVRGALVTGVVAGSPADQAGLKPGDIIVSWDDKQVDDPTLRLAVARSKVGSKAKIAIVREGEKQTLEVTVGQRPPQ